MDLQEVHSRQLFHGDGVCGVRRFQAEEYLLHRGHDAAQGRVLDMQPLHFEELAPFAGVQCLQVAPTAPAIDGIGSCKGTARWSVI